MQRFNIGLDRRQGRIAACLVVLLGVFAAAGSARAALCMDPLAAEATPRPGFHESLDLNALRRFYASAPICVWSDESAAALTDVLAKAAAHGLDPQDFHLAELARPAAFLDERLRDLLLSDAAIRYARDMRNGRVELESIEDDVDFPRPVIDPVAELRGAISRNAVEEWLAALPPRQPEYARLVDAYALYRGMAARGGWDALPPPEKSLRPGQASSLVPALRRRLQAEGDLAETYAAPEGGDRFEGRVVEAIEHFQRRHGLDADGILGKKTLAALNVSAAERAAQIAMNLERWRTLAGAIQPTRVEVNAAAATAALIIDGKPALTMRTVVGKKKTPTPIMRSVIGSIVVNPPWVIPASITRKEILPLLKRQPTYLAENDMYWRDNQIVQAPGEKNSLGRLKFELASSFDVYLHDTPARSLFARDDRARSHGCVRLEKPLELAERLLDGEPLWPRERIEAAIAEGATLRIPILDVPVVILYWTSFVDEDGPVEFRDDLYGRDARLMAALERRKPAPLAEIISAPKACGA